MGYEVFSREELARMLRTQVAAAQRYEDGPYRDGYLDALRQMAIALGLDRESPTTGLGIVLDWRNSRDQLKRDLDDAQSIKYSVK